jgi:hypothetical protein
MHHEMRGTNKNMNVLVRQYFPEHCDFRTVTEEELQLAMNRLNNRPRKCLSYRPLTRYSSTSHPLLFPVESAPLKKVEKVMNPSGLQLITKKDLFGFQNIKNKVWQIRHERCRCSTNCTISWYKNNVQNSIQKYRNN